MGPVPCRAFLFSMAAARVCIGIIWLSLASCATTDAPSKQAPVADDATSSATRGVLRPFDGIVVDPPRGAGARPSLGGSSVLEERVP